MVQQVPPFPESQSPSMCGSSGSCGCDRVAVWLCGYAVLWLWVSCSVRFCRPRQTRPGPCAERARTAARLRISPPDSESTVESCCSVSPLPANGTSPGEKTELLCQSRKHCRGGGGDRNRRAKRLCSQRSVVKVNPPQLKNNHDELASAHSHVTAVSVQNAPEVGGGRATNERGYAVHIDSDVQTPPASPTRYWGPSDDARRCCPWNEPNFAMSQEKLQQMRFELSSMNLGYVSECISVTRRANHAYAESSSRLCFNQHNKLWPGRVMEDLDAKQRNIYELHATAVQSALAKAELECPVGPSVRQDSLSKARVGMCSKGGRASAGIALISGLAGFGFIGGKRSASAGAVARAKQPAVAKGQCQL